MNRLKKEEARKYREAREGLTEAEVKQMDKKEASQQALEELTRQIHLEWFPEEYDFMMDSSADAKDRKRGVNPMSQDYTERANARRQALGVEPLGDNGLPTTRKSWEVAAEEARRRIG
ncbi:MAG: hypothetical protein LAT65_00010 [Saccharospirillum sp.]|nr:hypothetical protein [Saccharospirillum sp.]